MPEYRPPSSLSRRSALKLMAAAGVSLGVAAAAGRAPIRRPIPGSGESLPVVGLGTAWAFDVDPKTAGQGPLRRVLARFVELGGSAVDSSPMYGNAETAVGDLAAELGLRPSLFLATKVWTAGREAGIRQMQASAARLRTNRIDLMQIHNLVDWRTQLATLREWKAAGRIRYLGITHYLPSAFPEMERLVASERLDFVQLPYSLGEREAEQRLLPAAAAHDTAVLVNRPFADGALFRRVQGRPLPPWAAELDCASWAQFFLKFIIGHPAVTCTIPSTGRPEHLADNMGAGYGRLPDEAARRRMAAYLASV